MARDKPQQHRKSVETTRAVDEGGTVKLGEMKDDAGRTLYWSRRPFGYEGADLDRGQVVGFTGARNDEKLVRLGYVLSLLPKDRPLPCRYCAAQFIDLDTLNAHGAKRHSDRVVRPSLPSSDRGLTVDDTAAEVQQLEKEGAFLDQVAPLNYDKTTASRT